MKPNGTNSKANSGYRRNGIFSMAVGRWGKAKRLLLLQRFVEYTRYTMNKQNESKFLGRYKTRHLSFKQSKTRIFQISPESKMKAMFDLLVALINLYLAFSVPFRLAFKNQNDVPTLYFHDLILDGVLFIEICSRFFLAYYIDTTLIIDWKEIAKKNLKKIRFYTDLISVIPLYMLNPSLYWLKIGRILRVNNILDWVKNSKISSPIIKKYILKTHYLYEVSFKVWYFCVLVTITCHCIACMWYYIPTTEDTSMANTWLQSNERFSTADLYMKSLYWTAVTFSSVGYGDITPKTLPEYIYTMIIEFMGILCFAYLMGSISSNLAKYYSKKQALNVRENELNQWMILLEEQRSDKSLPQQLTSRIKEFFEQKWINDPASVHRFDDFFQILPPHLAGRLREHLYKSRVSLFHTFFDHFHEDTHLKLSMLLSPIRFQREEIIIKEEEKSNKIYFIVNGSAKIGILAKGFVAKLSEGSYFGEDCALFNDESTVSFVANEESNCFYMEYSKAFKIFKRNKIDIYPFAKISYKRNEFFKKLLNFKYDPESQTSTLAEFISEFDIMNENLNFEQYEDFNQRSRAMATFDLVKITTDLRIENARLNAEVKDHALQLKNFQDIYESEISKIVESLDFMNSGGSVKKAIKKLNKR